MDYRKCEKCNRYFFDRGDGHSCKEYQVAELDNYEEGQEVDYHSSLLADEWCEAHGISAEDVAETMAEKWNEECWDNDLDDDGRYLAVYTPDKKILVFRVMAEPTIDYSSEQVAGEEE